MMKGIASSPYNCMKFLVNDHIRSELNATHNKATERKGEKKKLCENWPKVGLKRKKKKTTTIKSAMTITKTNCT